MVLPSVIRLAYAKAKVGFVFGQRGLVMEACSSFFLPRLIGHSKAQYLVATGAVYTADSPHFGDLFNEILPTPEATLARAHELAQQIVKNTSIVSNKVMRDLMFRGPNSAEETHLLDSKMIHGLYGKKDNLEGIESFLEKRPPKFSGNVPADAPGNSRNPYHGRLLLTILQMHIHGGHRWTSASRRSSTDRQQSYDHRCMVTSASCNNILATSSSFL